MKTLLGVIVGILMFVSSGIFVVDQRKYAVVFQFGEAVRFVNQPGLNIKIPFIQDVKFFDRRILSAESDTKEITAADGKRIVVDAFARFTITDPIMFYKTVHDYSGLKIRLNKILESSLRKVVGTVSVGSLLSSERSNIMKQIQELLNKEAHLFGVVVNDVRILRTDLPKENSAAIFDRMIAERNKEAQQIRAEGQEEALRIISAADKEAKIIVSDAYMNAQVIKSQGDSDAATIYSDAYTRDTEFYRFYQSLETYKVTLGNGSTNFILPTDSKFLEYMSIGRN